MNKESIENLLGVIKTSTEKVVVLNGLLKLVTEVIKDRDGVILFRKAGGVKLMVRFLYKPHEDILEIVLSMLANCCIDEESCREAIECKVSVPLVNILKYIPNQAIQFRTCRLLGNLAKVNCALLLRRDCTTLAQSIWEIIEHATDVQTRIAALRACRHLLADPHLKYFLQEYEFPHILRILGDILRNDAIALPAESTDASGGRKYFEYENPHMECVNSDLFDLEELKPMEACAFSFAYAMPVDKGELDLVHEILKCLLIISDLQISANVWQKLYSATSILAPIVFLIWEEGNTYRRLALTILSNIAKNRHAFYLLSTADTIVAVCDLFVSENMERPLSESEMRCCMNVVCILSTNGYNRSKIRCSGALLKLLAMIGTSQSKMEVTSILYLVYSFRYDDMSMNVMLDMGLVSYLIKVLNDFLVDYKDKRYDKEQQQRNETVCRFFRIMRPPSLHRDLSDSLWRSFFVTTKQIDKKRKQPTSTPQEDSDAPSSSLRSSRRAAKRGNLSTSMLLKTENNDSPSLDSDSASSSSRSYVGASSLCSSRGISPVVSNLIKINLVGASAEADDETYSPVCRYDEGEEEESNTQADISEAQSIEAVKTDDNNSSMDNLAKEDDAKFETFPAITIDIVKKILFPITLLGKKRFDLVKPETVDTLIRAVELLGATCTFGGCLVMILMECHFLPELIKQSVPHRLFQLTKSVETRTIYNYSLMNNLTRVGESNEGKTELMHLLSCGDATLQNRTAIAVAHIIRNRLLLHQFLKDGNALAHLVGIILHSEQDDLVDEAVQALITMVRTTLGITVKQRSDDTKYKDFLKDNALIILEESDMRFIVHEDMAELTEDNTEEDPNTTTTSATILKSAVTVGFNKQLLCNASEVFNSMLNSTFREGREGIIHLYSCSAPGLRYFLNLIWRQAHRLKLDSPPPHQLFVLLEALELARSYIIPMMELFLQQLIVSRLNVTNCSIVFDWAIENCHYKLCETVISYYLSTELSPEEKVKLFRIAHNSNFSTEWHEMLMKVVSDRCPGE